MADKLDTTAMKNAADINTNVHGQTQTLFDLRWHGCLHRQLPIIPLCVDSEKLTPTQQSPLAVI